MIETLFQVIENTAFNDWFLISMLGFPTFIVLHSVGMAFVVGLSIVIAFRYFSIGQQHDHSTMLLLFKAAWFGFALNLVTGIVLLSARISDYLFDTTFLVKMGLLLSAAFGLRVLHHDLLGVRKLVFLSLKTIAGLTVLLWLGAITAGRLIAYLSGVY